MQNTMNNEVEFVDAGATVTIREPSGERSESWIWFTLHPEFGVHLSTTASHNILTKDEISQIRAVLQYVEEGGDLHWEVVKNQPWAQSGAKREGDITPSEPSSALTTPDGAQGNRSEVAQIPSRGQSR